MTITDFLEARISEDETRIQYAPKYSDPFDADLVPLREDVRARLMSECQAKRAIIVSHGSCAATEGKTDADMELGLKLVSAGMTQGLELATRMLAAVYANHPDYLPEWKL